PQVVIIAWFARQRGRILLAGMALALWGGKSANDVSMPALPEDLAMMSALASKIIVVTGATGQVGWGIAHAALDTGATVVLPVRSEAARKKVKRDFGKARISIVTVNFADEIGLASMRDATLERFG